MRSVAIATSLLTAVLGLNSCRSSPEPLPASAANPVESPPSATRRSALQKGAEDEAIRCGVQMRNVALHVAADVVLAVRSLDGEFVSRVSGEPPAFDDPKSYVLRIRSAKFALDAAS